MKTLLILNDAPYGSEQGALTTRADAGTLATYLARWEKMDGSGQGH